MSRQDYQAPDAVALPREPALLTDKMAAKRIQAAREFIQRCERLEAVPPISLARFHAGPWLSDGITEGELIDQKAAPRWTLTEKEEAWREYQGAVIAIVQPMNASHDLEDGN